MKYRKNGWYMCMDGKGVFHASEIKGGRRLTTGQDLVIFKPTEDELYAAVFVQPYKIEGEYKIEFLMKKRQSDLVEEAVVSKADEYIPPKYSARVEPPIKVEPRDGWVNP